MKDLQLNRLIAVKSTMLGFLFSFIAVEFNPLSFRDAGDDLHQFLILAVSDPLRQVQELVEVSDLQDLCLDVIVESTPSRPQKRVGIRREMGVDMFEHLNSYQSVTYLTNEMGVSLRHIRRDQLV